MGMSLDKINQKLKDLETKKKELELRDAKQLYKSLQHTLGEAFSANLVTTIVSKTWETASTDQKEGWVSANTFRKGTFTNKTTNRQAKYKDKAHAAPAN